MSQTEIVKHYNERWTADQDETEEQYVPEKYQLGIVVDFLETLGIDHATEQSIFSYPIDVLCANGDETIAIELKSRNVGKGIQQALRNSDYVDFSFLAVWEKDVTDRLLERVSDLPIGLLAVGADVEIVSSPDKTAQQLCRRGKVIELVKGDV
ncbi:uncharacterized protein HHUB_2198 [Halobacterium hubeiense]|uniref:Uncharacterized protein n=1 Tax=Halobacterium hubeiense TaxID=1407499 RepID=A0A0U5GZU8_9EURY|nr:hypothetical protein [Halobacterium hubeiense]CQH55203.1 uncharacterized protein HHUB_2198 [Halobacterium hubeiense]